MRSFQRISLEMFFSLQWDMPDARVVGISLQWTTALASAEGSPATLLRKVLQLTP